MDSTEERIVVYEFITGYALDRCIDMAPNEVTEIAWRYHLWLYRNSIDELEEELSYVVLFDRFDDEMKITDEFCMDKEDLYNVCLVAHITAQALARQYEEDE